MIFDWVFWWGFFPVFVCFRKAVRNKIASHCAGQSWIMEVLMITQQQRWWGVERPKLTSSSSSADISKDKKMPPFFSTPWPYLSMGPSKPSVWALKRLEPTGLVGNAKQVVGDGAPPPLPALPFPLISQKFWIGKQIRQEWTAYLRNQRRRSEVINSNSCT